MNGACLLFSSLSFGAVPEGRDGINVTSPLFAFSLTSPELNVDESGVGAVYYIMAGISFIFIILFFPFSLLYTIKVELQGAATRF